MAEATATVPYALHTPRFQRARGHRACDSRLEVAGDRAFGHAGLPADLLHGEAQSAAHLWSGAGHRPYPTSDDAQPAIPKRSQPANGACRLVLSKIYFKIRGQELSKRFGEPCYLAISCTRHARFGRRAGVVAGAPIRFNCCASSRGGVVDFRLIDDWGCR